MPSFFTSRTDTAIGTQTGNTNSESKALRESWLTDKTAEGPFYPRIYMNEFLFFTVSSRAETSRWVQDQGTAAKDTGLVYAK